MATTGKEQARANRQVNQNQWRVFFDLPTETNNMQFLGCVEAPTHEEAVQAAIVKFDVSEPEKLIVVY